MPITPFHFGPGLLYKSAAPRSVSWTVFALANVVIDVEPIIWYLTTGDPVHGVLHTVLGATGLGVGVGLLGRSACESGLCLWNERLSPAQQRWLAVNPRISLREALVSGLAGTWSHILLDNQMHADMSPWWPFFSGNDWRGVISVDVLHWSCVVSGVLGAAWLALRRTCFGGRCD